MTATGFAIDSGHKDLTHVFAGFYIAGCVIAVLVVQQAGVFTAIIQPPLILFCAVPSAYWLFHGRKVGSIKDLLINCGYPLIERFPLMLGTAGGVLLIGLLRWFIGTSRRKSAPNASDAQDEAAAAGTSEQARAEKKLMISGITGLLNSMLGLNSRPRTERAEELASAEATRMHAGAGAPNSARPPGSSRGAARTSRSRSRHAGPPLDERHEPAPERPRRSTRRDQPPPRDYDPAEAPRRARRRPRPEADPNLADYRAQAPREMRREPRTRRDPYERPARSSRFEPHDRHDPHGAPEHFEPQRHRPAPNGTNGPNPSHHPISQVRYRGSGPRDERRDEPRQEAPDRHSRSGANGRTRGRPPADSWEYEG
jgi:hypothetical protein